MRNQTIGTRYLAGLTVGERQTLNNTQRGRVGRFMLVMPADDVYEDTVWWTACMDEARKRARELADEHGADVLIRNERGHLIYTMRAVPTIGTEVRA